MLQLYTGFYSGCNTEGKEKCPDVKYITKGKTFAEVEQSPNILGVLREDIVMVDFDADADAQAFQRILDSQGIKVPTLITTRGMHFYFKANPSIVNAAHTHVRLSCGLVADFKLGAKKGLDLIKFKGQLREWRNEHAELIPAPRLFLTKVDNNVNSFSLTALTEGSRNDTLFKFVGQLKRKQFTFEECRNLIAVINKLVLPKPLPEREIMSICRLDAYDNAYDGKPSSEGKIDHVSFAEELLVEQQLASIGNALYFKDNGVYQRLDKVGLERLMFLKDKTITLNQRKEVAAFCNAMAPRYDSDIVLSRPNYMAFNNGVVDVITQTVEPFENVDLPFTSRVPFNFPTSEPPRNETVETFLDAITCGHADRRQLLLEMVGSCLYRKNVLRSIFILTGDRANGKSTLLKFINYALGIDNVSNLSIHELNNQFYVSKLIGKLANLGDDIGDGFIADSSTLKSLATSDRIIGNIKYQEPIEFNSYASLIFTANFMPRVNDPTGAFMSRLQVVKFEADFSQNPDVNILDRLCTPDCASYMLYLGARSFAYALGQGKFTETADSAESKAEFTEESNPVALFIEQEYDPLNKLDKAVISEVYDAFNRFCVAEGCATMSRSRFTRRVKAVVKGLGSKKASVGGKKVRVFYAIGELKLN